MHHETLTESLDFDLTTFTPYRLAIAAQKVSEALAKIYRQQFGISIPEWRVLVHIWHEQSASVRDIEAQVALEKSKVSRAADRLCERGLLSKATSTKDRRLLELTLTMEGHKLMAELIPLVIAFQRKIQEQLGAEFKGLEAGLTKILEGNDP